MVNDGQEKKEMVTIGPWSKMDTKVITANVNGGAEGNFWERNFDMLELTKNFTELKFSLDFITMILNSQPEKKDDLIL